MMIMMFVMMVAPVLLVGLAVAAAGAGAGLFAQGLRLPGKPAPGARDVLAQRYAQGEISKDQYDQVLADITG
jgi:uncharacterized membrane protein